MVWLEIPEFPTYDATEEGVISNGRTHQLVKYHKTKEGVLYAGLYKDGKQYSRAVAPIIAQLFLDPPPSSIFDTPIHLDGDRSNIRADNLMWRPRWFAIKYHQQFTRERADVRMTIHLTETKETFRNPMEAAIKYGLLERSIIVDAVNGDPTFPYGFHFWA